MALLLSRSAAGTDATRFRVSLGPTHQSLSALYIYIFQPCQKPCKHGVDSNRQKSPSQIPSLQALSFLSEVSSL